MESLRFLVFLCFMSCFSLGNTNAQVLPIMRYNTFSEITTKSLCDNLDTFSLKNDLCLFRMKGLPLWGRDITEVPNSDFLFTSRNYNGLLSKSVLFTDKGIRLTGKYPSMTSYGNSVTFNGKWKRLTGKPIIDTSRVYYCPVKITNNPFISNNLLYRTSANIFNMLVSVKYPYLDRSK
jgi:hypothetical protein